MNLQEKRQQTYNFISSGKFKKASPGRVSSLFWGKYLRKQKNVEILQILSVISKHKLKLKARDRRGK